MQIILHDYLWSGDISDFDGISLFFEVEKQMREQDAGIDDTVEEETT